MARVPIKVNEHFVVKVEDGNETEVIYNPPLLAESENIRLELRKEKNHATPHVHVIKKGQNKSYDVSIALDGSGILAGVENLERFDRREFEKIAEFIAENTERFKEIYKKLRGDL